jgi:hypothetical protein
VLYRTEKLSSEKWKPRLTAALEDWCESSEAESALRDMAWLPGEHWQWQANSTQLVVVES